MQSYDPSSSGNSGRPPTTGSGGQGRAIAGLVLGILSIPAAIFAILGLVIGVVGLLLSMLGRRAGGRIADAGIVLSCIGLFLALINAAAGFYLGITGQYHPFGG